MTRSSNDRLVSIHWVAFKIGKRDFSHPLPPNANEEEKARDALVFKAIREQVDRGRLPMPVVGSRGKGNRLRWWQSDIEAYLQALESPRGHRRGRPAKAKAQRETRGAA